MTIMCSTTNNRSIASPLAADTPAIGPELAIELLIKPTASIGHLWVKAGDAVARVLTDAPCHHDAPVVALGEGVVCGADGRTITATIDGRILVGNGRLCVARGQIIQGNIDPASPKIDAHDALRITGNVADTCSVTASDSIQVDGIIEEAAVYAATDLCAIGGISGKQKGHCLAGNRIEAKYIVNANVEAGGDITSDVIARSRVVCGGKVLVDRGPILAGHITAAGDVVCQAIGSTAEVATIIEAGIDAKLRDLACQKIPEIQSLAGKARKTRETVESLMHNPKTLTAQQKERATELLFEADELESRMRSMIQELKTRYDLLPHRDATVRVQENLYPGVTICFPGYSTTIRQTLSGPLKLLTQQIRGSTRVVIIYGENGAAHPLPTTKLDDDVMLLLHRLFQSGNEQSDR